MRAYWSAVARRAALLFFVQSERVDIASVRGLRRGAEVEDPYNLGDVNSRHGTADRVTDHDHRE